MKTCMPCLGFICLGVFVGFTEAQELDRPSILVPPWGGSAAPNLAAELTERVSSGIDSLDLFDLVEWEGLLNSLRPSLDIPDPVRAPCPVGRQLAVLEDIEFVLCGGVGPTQDGLRLELLLYDIGSGEAIQFSPIIANSQDSLVEHALAQLSEWKGLNGWAQSGVFQRRFE